MLVWFHLFQIPEKKQAILKTADQRLGPEAVEMTDYKGASSNLGGLEILCDFNGDGIAYTCVKAYWFVCVKWIRLIVCKLNIDKVSFNKGSTSSSHCLKTVSINMIVHNYRLFYWENIQSTFGLQANEAI